MQEWVMELSAFFSRWYDFSSGVSLVSISPLASSFQIIVSPPLSSKDCRYSFNTATGSLPCSSKITLRFVARMSCACVFLKRVLAVNGKRFMTVGIVHQGVMHLVISTTLNCMAFMEWFMVGNFFI